MGILLFFNHLWSNILHCTTEGLSLKCMVNAPAEICYLHVKIVIIEYVLQFYIPMHNISLMHIRQCLGDLQEN